MTKLTLQYGGEMTVSGAGSIGYSYEKKKKGSWFLAHNICKNQCQMDYRF